MFRHPVPHVCATLRDDDSVSSAVLCFIERAVGACKECAASSVTSGTPDQTPIGRRGFAPERPVAHNARRLQRKSA
jgi:hypothetical protein